MCIYIFIYIYIYIDIYAFRKCVCIHNDPELAVFRYANKIVSYIYICMYSEGMLLLGTYLCFVIYYRYCYVAKEVLLLETYLCFVICCIYSGGNVITGNKIVIYSGGNGVYLCFFICYIYSGGNIITGYIAMFYYIYSERYFMLLKMTRSRIVIKFLVNWNISLGILTRIPCQIYTRLEMG